MGIVNPYFNDLVRLRGVIQQHRDENKTLEQIKCILNTQHSIGCTYSQIRSFIRNNEQWFPKKIKANEIARNIEKRDIIDIIADELRMKIKPIGGLNLISKDSIKRKLSLDTMLDFTDNQLIKAIYKLVFEGRLISKGNGFFIICAPKVEGFKSVGEVAAAIHKAIGVKHAA